MVLGLNFIAITELNNDLISSNRKILLPLII